MLITKAQKVEVMAGRVAACCLVLSVCVGGCSLVAMDRLDSGYRRETSPRCSASQVPAILDLAVGSVYVLMAGKYERERREDDYTAIEAADVGGALAMAAVAYGSMVYGWRQVARCKEARDAHDRWLGQVGRVGGDVVRQEVVDAR